MTDADVGSDRGEPSPIGQVLHGREGKKEETKQEEEHLRVTECFHLYHRCCTGTTTVLARAKGRKRHLENCA